MSLASNTIESIKLKILLELFDHIRCGSLTVTLPSGVEHKCEGKKDGPHATIQFHNIHCVDALLKQGDIGLGETYMNGDWDTDDLPTLLTFFVVNLQAIEHIIHGKRIFQLLWRLSSLFTRNTKRGSRKNIYKHYDLGNDFYKLWLDKSLTYSSGIFLSDTDTLADAQRQKYGRILEHIGEKPSHILEIGCGWGGFAEEAARRGHKVTCLTISTAQATHARKRLKKANLDHLVTIKICDYRDMHDTFDHIVSIEMIEAVGQEFWETYFECLKRCIKPGGKVIIQGITINNDIFEDYQNRIDFIQKHIFPGGMLLSPRVFNDLSTQFGFNINESFAFGPSYEMTLHHWLRNVEEEYHDIQKLGFTDSFIRKWKFYLAYCIAGFSTNQTDVYQFVLQSPQTLTQHPKRENPKKTNGERSPQKP